MNVRLSKEQKIKVLNSDGVYTVMQSILLRENQIRRNQEHFWVVGLDNKNKILFVELISLGASNRVTVNPPEVFRMAIYKLAVKMILVHNHPSGSLTPSDADLDLTDRMMKTGKLIKIEVLDHLIISEKEHFSFESEGIIDDLKKTGKYEIIDREKARLQDWKIRLESEKAKKDEKLAIAKKMKAEGMDEKLIKKMTGLFLGDIRGL